MSSKDAKWNEETKSGTYSDKIHHGEMKRGWDKNPILSGKPKAMTPIQNLIGMFEAWSSVSCGREEAKLLQDVIKEVKKQLPVEKKLIEDTWDECETSVYSATYQTSDGIFLDDNRIKLDKEQYLKSIGITTS